MFLLLVIVFQIYPIFVCSECFIDINKDFNIQSPLLLSKNSLDIIYPKKITPKYLAFSRGENVLIFCFGGSITRLDNSIHSTNEVSRCVKNSIFSNPFTYYQYPFDEVGCSTSPNPINIEDTTRTCKNGVVINIGYQLTKTIFKKTIDLCFVKELETTTWAHNKISSIISGNKYQDLIRPAFTKGSYFKDVFISRDYKKSQQYNTFMEIFNNDKDVVEQYIIQEGDKRNHFVKGLLVAHEDMFYRVEKWSAYTFLNVLPIWRSIYKANWKSVELAVRRMAAYKDGLDVWTGGIGVLKLDNRKIFLGHNKHGLKQLSVPVPQLLFKLAYSQKNNTALAFITVNDPYISAPLPNTHIICQEFNTCDEKFPQFKNTYEGYTYCCLYDDFKDSPVVKELELPMDFINVEPLNLL